MKVTQFTMPVVNKYFIVVQQDILPYFYNYMHRHNELQITLIVKGDGTLIAGNYIQPCKPGDIFFIGENTPHLFRSNPNHFLESKKNNVHAVHIFINHKHNLSSILDLPEFLDLNKFITGSVHSLQNSSLYTKKISQLILEVSETDGIDRLLALIKLLQLCVSNTSEWALPGTTFNNSDLDSDEGPRMNDVYQYTKEHYAENISLKKIASIACITPHAFCKYFKKHTRKTYLSFLHEVRIHEACKKIINNNFESIAEVAYATGFNNVITFNRVFKKLTTMSPKDYLQKYKFKKHMLD
jgi:YesN/AraC family two-component response regulator